MCAEMLIVNQNRPNWGIILRITLALMAAILPPAASQCGCTECTSQDAVAASDTLELRMICEDGEIFLDYFSVESDSDVDVIFQDPYDGLYWTAFGSTSSRCHSFDDFDFSNAVSPADYGVSILIECNNLFFDCMVNYGGRLLCIDPSTNLTLPSATPQPSRTYPPSPSSAPSTVPTTQPSAPVPRYNTDMRVYFPKGDSEQCVKNELLDFYSAPCTSVVALCPYPFGDNTSVPCSDLKEWYECIDRCVWLSHLSVYGACAMNEACIHLTRMHNRHAAQTVITRLPLAAHAARSLQAASNVNSLRWAP